MSENLPYNGLDDQQDLPLPDADMAWQKMKKMLEEEDKNKPLIPPGILKTCAGWGLMAAALLTAWFYFNPLNRHAETAVSTIPAGSTSITSPQNSLPSPSKASGKSETDPNPVNTTPTSGEPEPASGRSKDLTSNGPRENNNQVATSSTDENGLPVTKEQKQATEQLTKGKATSRASHVTAGGAVKVQKHTVKNSSSAGKGNNPASFADPDPSQTGVQDKGTPTQNVPSQKSSVADSSMIHPSKPARLIILSPVVVSLKPGKPLFEGEPVENPLAMLASKPMRVKKYFVTAGLGMQQQLPFMHVSKDSVEDEFSRQTSIADYVPSIYFRLHRMDKWFLQGEFRYGAPQSVKEFSYSQQTMLQDSFLTTTTLRLKKTYYHQLPISFNYYLRPGWSVGLGGIYSRFYRAVTEEEVFSKDIQTQAEKVSKKIVEVPGFTDSFFYKTQIHVLFQTDYEWKRFSVGLRYTHDIQPYIKYTQPNGEINEERNQSLQVFLRFRLWKSNRFNIGK